MRIIKVDTLHDKGRTLFKHIENMEMLNNISFKHIEISKSRVTGGGGIVG